MLTSLVACKLERFLVLKEVAMVMESLLTMVEQVEFPRVMIDTLLKSLEWGKKRIVGLMTRNFSMELGLQVW